MGFFNKIKFNKGSSTLESCYLAIIILPIFTWLIFGSYTFFLTQSVNNNINFDAGRYASLNGCSPQGLRNIGANSEFSGYTIKINGTKPENLPSGSLGEIDFLCSPNSDKGSEFRVISSTNVNSYGMFFPLKAARVGYYTQEIKSSKINEDLHK